MMTMTLTVLKL